MKKALFSIFIGLAASLANAGDFVNHINNKAQDIPQTHVQIINFWAAWCKPCRKEMPDMSKWYTQIGKKQKVGMVGIAIDSPENVSQFLKQVPVKYPILRYTGTNSRAMMSQFANQIGGLPYTVIRAPKCAYEEKIVGELTFDRLNQAVQKAQSSCSK